MNVTSNAASGDLQVRQIEFQISDWKCCPTTDARTKAQKVSELEVKLQAAKAAADQSGKGKNLDVQA